MAYHTNLPKFEKFLKIPFIIQTFLQMYFLSSDFLRPFFSIVFGGVIFFRLNKTRKIKKTLKSFENTEEHFNKISEKCKKFMITEKKFFKFGKFF